jgi:hypothetical protein
VLFAPVNDNFAYPSRVVTISPTLTTTDALYNALNMTSAVQTVTIVDNDELRVLWAATPGLTSAVDYNFTLSEETSSVPAIRSVSLASQPRGAVEIVFPANAQINLSYRVIRFYPTEASKPSSTGLPEDTIYSVWDVPVVISVTCVDDSTIEGDATEVYFFSTKLVNPSDAAFVGVPTELTFANVVGYIAVTIIDDDTVFLSVTPDLAFAGLGTLMTVIYPGKFKVQVLFVTFICVLCCVPVGHTGPHILIGTLMTVIYPGKFNHAHSFVSFIY